MTNIDNFSKSSNLQRQNFKLMDLDDPIAPSTPETHGVQLVAAGIVFLAMVPGVVDMDTPNRE